MIKTLSEEAVNLCGIKYIISKEDAQAIAREAKRYTIEQIVGWGEEPCPHPPKSISAVMSGTKRTCYLCWQELKEESKRVEI